MTTLVVGATGATGRLLVEQLLEQGGEVRAVVRSPEGLSERVRNDARVSVIPGSVLDMGDDDVADAVAGCSAVASCLGHNVTFGGMFAPPHRLVTDTLSRLCAAIRAQREAGGGAPVRVVLMSSTGVRNPDLDERIPVAQKAVIGVLRLILPPHADNEDAARFLRTTIGPDDGAIEWVAVRPDSLINEPAVSEYELHPSPIRSAIFNPGKTSRINVAHFMASLMTDDRLWNEWKGHTPVVYNTA
jgi:NAD(P)-dependent dehydrogenase (short-subunit alcohol dehydrogenase family)